MGHEAGKQHGHHAAAGQRPQFFDEEVVPRLNVARNVWIKPTADSHYEISYVLPEPARVTIVVRDQGSPALLLRRVLLFSHLQPAGTHRVEWDGRDESAIAVDVGKCYVKVYTEPESFSLPVEQARIINDDPAHLMGHIHVLHEPSECGQLALEMPRTSQRVSGVVEFDVWFKNAFRGRGHEWGMGVRLFVGRAHVAQITLASEDAGRESVKLKLDTTTFPDGLHVVTVNICDHNEHEGAVSAVWEFANASVDERAVLGREELR